MTRLSRRLFLRHSALSAMAVSLMGRLCLARTGRAGESLFPETSAGLAADGLSFHPLWPEDALPVPAGMGPMRITPGGSASRISQPGLYIMRPARPNGAAMLIAGGGGYRHIELGHEALPAARRLAGMGITAAILLYRLPGEGWPEGAGVSLADARRGLHMLQTGMAGEGLDSHRLGLMGFSAGGHLAGLTGLLAPARSSAPPPAGLMLLYPIVSVAPPFARSHTARALLGHDPAGAEPQRWSLPPHVHREAPPLFLAYAEDDPIASPAQQAQLVQAYRARQRPCEVHAFPLGGHGFGMGRRHGPTHHWFARAFPWLGQHGFL